MADLIGKMWVRMLGDEELVATRLIRGYDKHVVAQKEKVQLRVWEEMKQEIRAAEAKQEELIGPDEKKLLARWKTAEAEDTINQWHGHQKIQDCHT